MKKPMILALPLLALGACDGMQSGASSYSVDAATAGADFRYGAREAVAGLDPVCPYSEEEEQLARYEPLRTRMAALEERVAGTALAIDLAVVRADYGHYWTINDAPCGETDTAETEGQIDGELEKIDNALTRMEAAAGVT